MLRKFLQILRPHDLKLRDDRWRDKLGSELVAVLRRARALDAAGLAETYECGGVPACGERRRVVAAPAADGHTHLALCAIDGGCLDLSLREPELRLSTLSFEATCELLCETLGIERAASFATVTPDVFLLGSVERSGVRADAYLALNPDLEAFPHLLTARGSASRATVVFVNTARFLPPTLIDLHGPGRRVEIVQLEDCLALENGALITRASARTLAAAPTPNTAPVCVRIDEAGEHALDAEGYAAAVARAESELDLLLDFSTQHHLTKRRVVYAGGRRRNGRYEPIEMRTSEAAVAAELIERTCRGGYVRPRDLERLQGNSMQTFHRAWQALDPEPREWLEKKAGTRDADAEYRFAPRRGRRWALLKPPA